MTVEGGLSTANHWNLLSVSAGEVVSRLPSGRVGHLPNCSNSRSIRWWHLHCLVGAHLGHGRVRAEEHVLLLLVVTGVMITVMTTVSLTDCHSGRWRKSSASATAGRRRR